jgi:hypothetical protein
MKKVRISIMLLALCVALIAAGQPALAANYLENIGITRSGDSIVVNIATSAPCQYNAFLTESKPERIVIDLSGVVNNLPDKQFLDLPLHSIKSIRTSQFKSDPEPQARVVLDIRRPIDFRYSQNGNSVVIKLPAASDEIAFTRWESSASDEIITPPAPAKVVTAEKKAVQPPPVQVAQTPVQDESNDVDVAPAVEEKPAVVEERIAEKPKPPVKVAQALAKTEEDDSITPAANDEVMKPAVEPEDVEPIRETASSNVSDNKEPIKPADLAVNSASSATPGVPVDTTPKRQLVEYTSSSLKDPFVPLIGVGKIVDGLPSLENLKLVGILENNEMNRALLEDGEGNGYILKPNDRVQSGYLVTVTESKAIFQVTEYGWTRTVALELVVPEIR